MKRRVNYLINKKLKLGFAAKFAFFITLFSAFIGFQFYAIVWPAVFPFVPEQAVSLIGHQIFFRGICFLSLTALVIIAIAIAIFHRMASPIFSMVQTIDRIVRGEAVEFIRPRKNDDLKGLEEKMNGLITLIKELKEKDIGVRPTEKT